MRIVKWILIGAAIAWLLDFLSGVPAASIGFLVGPDGGMLVGQRAGAGARSVLLVGWIFLASLLLLEVSTRTRLLLAALGLLQTLGAIGFGVAVAVIRYRAERAEAE